LRDTTVRPVTVELGTNTVLGAEPRRIAEIPTLLAEPHHSQPIPLWDGRAGERAADVLIQFVAGARLAAGCRVRHRGRAQLQRIPDHRRLRNPDARDARAPRA